MNLIQKITPHLWFDKEAKEAAKFYTSIFKDSDIKNKTTLHNTPSGTADIITIKLCGQDFTLISAGPLFKFNPSVSFLVACNTKEEVEELWGELSGGGFALMELGEYPFSEKYGWVQDRYGLSWQVMFMGDREIKQIITPTLMFVGKVCGKAEEAINFYTSVFNNAKVGDILRYSKGEEPDKEGTIKHAAFTLEGQEFASMDSARVHNFNFNEAISFIVHCDTQKEIDYYWGKLSAYPEAEQCGWLKDKFGLSWQIVPTIMNEMLKDKDKKNMRKIIVSEFLTLDGVMQAPGGPDEDRSGGFEHGGWQQPYFDDIDAKVVIQGLTEAGAFLLGRRTYEIFAAYWPTAPEEAQAFADPLNNLPKFVVSKTLREPLAWNNSTLIAGDVANEIAHLKRQPGNDIMVIGSGELAQMLMKHDLVDEYRLMIHPLVLGSGKRLFRDGGSKQTLRLLDFKTTSKGVIILKYKTEK